MQFNDPNLLVTQAWINGTPTTTGDNFDVTDPSTGALLAQVSDCGTPEIDQAIKACTQAQNTWQQIPPRERHRMLLAWSELLARHITDLSRLLSQENGKPLQQATDEIQHCVTMLVWYGEQARRLTGTLLPKHSSSQQNYTIQQPEGVVACITPWNFPAAAVVVKAGAAIAAGCCCIVKPSEHTPLIALAIARLASVAGLPAGVLNVVPTLRPEPMGQRLCHSEAIAMLSFTGSSKVGKWLYRQCSQTLKKLAMELGGNAPFIVFDDCDIDLAVAAVLSARFYNSGQICVGANRIFVQRALAPRFSQKLTQAVTALKLGGALEPNTDVGPLIHHSAKQRLQHLVDNAVAQGAQMLTPFDPRHTDDSVWFTPTVLSNMNASMAAYHAEIFGPVACLYTFDDEAEVIARANDTRAGLAAYVYSSHYPRLIRLSEQLHAGNVGANSTQLFSEDVPFGGINESGFGKEQGLKCLEEFTRTKSIALGLLP